jgi:hypothetical protein
VAETNPSREIADRAVALATSNDGDQKEDTAELLELAGNEAGPLEEARRLLVRRIRTRSDDFQATAGLSLLNAALSQLGKRDDLAWTPRQWRIPR